MQVRWRWFAVWALLVWAATPAQAETVHLVTGEVIKGKIVRADPDAISVESDKGFGVIQIRRGDITLIEFEGTERDLSRTLGVGYHHRATPSSVGAQAAEYGVDALSLKMWLSKTDSVDLQLGFYSTSQSDTALLEIFTLDLRYATVLRRQAQTDIYIGGSLGYINVTDNTLGSSVEGTGYTLRGFAGVELFLTTLPNVGISAELGIGMQTVGNRNTVNLSTTTFPALSLRYYF